MAQYKVAGFENQQKSKDGPPNLLTAVLREGSGGIFIKKKESSRKSGTTLLRPFFFVS
jgi:hypothetical protein